LRPKLILLVVAALALTGAACRQDMHDQPKIKAYRASDFFGDGRGMRPLPEGTVARGDLRDDDLLYTGKVNGQPVDEFPFEVTRAVLERGHDRFNIYCSPCHGRTGLGNGMIVQRGLKPPPSFHEDRVQKLAVGYYFDVMTNGFGVMQDYRAQVAPEDRWAIAAYIRALQYSQHATVDDVPEANRASLDHPAAAGTMAPAEHGGSH
jgi:mono/diheme cytochrome c family protein